MLINDEFLLKSKVGKKIYNDYVKDLPIIDYHCHLDPKEIYDDIVFDDISHAWLGGDHYKWRLMRANGITEDYITGGKPAFEKFNKWSETVPYLIASPLYHWTHMELKTFFNIDDLLTPKTALDIFNKANQKLEELSARTLIKMSNVETLCTTDDPTDDLKYHQLLKAEEKAFNVLPAFRPDKAINIELSWFGEWINKLSQVVNYKIDSYKKLKEALRERIIYFNDNGANVSDHGLDILLYEKASEEELAEIFVKGLAGESLTTIEIAKYKGNLLVYLGKLYHEFDWVQQYHIGAHRNNSDRMLEALGPDTGYDSINDGLLAIPLRNILNDLDLNDQLPKTIIYTLNPRDFEVAITLMQSFQGGGVSGKVQFGAPWWFLDQKDGIEKHFNALGNNGLLSKFIGMLTDSRSFLSYPRHDYFRRILCNFLGEQVESGLFPKDYELLGEIAANISYYNAKKYFKF